MATVTDVAPDMEQRAWPPRRVVILAAVILCSHLPFLALYFRNLWHGRPHYEFFPVVLAAFAWLLWTRWPRGTVQHNRWSRVLSWTLLSSGLVFLSGAVVLFSPWLAAIAAALCVGGCLLGACGNRAIRDLVPVWLLLWLAIPPPWRLDEQLVRGLQSMTARTTGVLLDFFGVQHLRTGNVFQLPNRELFVAEACSGVHSQLVLVAASFVLAIVARRRWLHCLLLIPAAVFWSAVANNLRVTAVVLAAARWNVDLSTGWIHEVLGYGLVLFGFLMVLGTDQFLVGLLAPVSLTLPAERDESLIRVQNPLARLWNWAFADAEQAVSGERVDNNVLPQREPATSARNHVRLWMGCGMAGMFLSLAALQMASLSIAGRGEIDLDQLTGAFPKDWLPERIGSWAQVDYRTEQRDSSSDEGRYSHIWCYESENEIAQVSTDFPFVGWHELTRCYQARGWTIESRRVLSAPDSHGGPIVEVELSKPTGETGLLLFSLFDSRGRPVTPQVTHWRGIRGKLATSPLAYLLGNSVSTSATTLQVQQFATRLRPLGDAQRRELHDLYVRMRARMQQSWQQYREVDRRGD